jgi:tyrosine-protein phosphatase SIW14
MEEALSTMSRTPSFTAVAMEASLSTSTSDSDSRCTSYASRIHHGTFTDITIASSISPPMSTDGRPFNFGVVIPGVYRSSFPKLHDFEYIKGLGLKTIVLVTHFDIL